MNDTRVAYWAVSPNKGTAPAFWALGGALPPSVIGKAGTLLPDGYPVDVFEAITKGFSARQIG